ncbi:MAG: hypothetical protein IPM80_23230 [Proteobacteria bacterium]|nr:hypothetical protein [Pseudomonadota bacterium]
MRINAGIFVAGLLTSGAVLAADCADDSGPRKALENYITAMQAHKFNDAYNFVTSNMTDGKSREDWAAQQKLFYEGGEVNILSMDIRKAQGTDDDATCGAKANVPNILKSRDKFNNQGTTEFEVYVTVKDGNTWKVDSQETLFDAEGVQKWFPGEKVPEFKDQY